LRRRCPPRAGSRRRTADASCAGVKPSRRAADEKRGRRSEGDCEELAGGHGCAAMDACTSSTDGGRRGAALPVPEKRSRDSARSTSLPCRHAAVTERRFELILALNRRRSAAEGHAGEDRAPPREFRRPTEEGAGAGRSPRQQGREREAGRAG
jgi:hypothetical protein